jgi:PiT family inorganic phosphate transporter
VIHDYVTINVIAAGLLAAITWNLITWWFGIPSSSSHTLIGGFAGAGMTNAIFMGVNPFDAVKMDYIITIASYIVLAPFIGLFIAYIITVLILHACKNAKPSSAESGLKPGSWYHQQR